MTTQERIIERIDLVQAIFRDVLVRPLEDNLSELVTRLEECDPEFLSLAYEAASYKIAVGKDLSIWKEFLLNYAKKHSVQVHIGLGWAAARMNTPIEELTEFVSSENIRYVMDGSGFYYGTFKKRVAIENKQQYSNLGEYGAYFDEGLGRSIWYSSQGNLDEIEKTIDSFPVNRKPNIWRGIGIAFTYAGGFDLNTIISLKKNSGKFVEQVKAGVASVAKTRITAGTINDYTRLVCKEICDLTLE